MHYTECQMILYNVIIRSWIKREKTNRPRKLLQNLINIKAREDHESQRLANNFIQKIVFFKVYNVLSIYLSIT